MDKVRFLTILSFACLACSVALFAVCASVELPDWVGWMLVYGGLVLLAASFTSAVAAGLAADEER